MKKYLLIGGLLVTILSTYICYSSGWARGFAIAGYTAGYNEAISAQDETAFVDGCNSGIQEIVRSVCNPRDEYQSFRKITVPELRTFLKSDKTDEIKYSDNFTCSGYALTLKKNANDQGIKCAFVVLNYKDEFTGKTDTGHCINAFEVEGGGQMTADEEKRLEKLPKLSDITGIQPHSNIIYVEPQTDAIIDDLTVGKPYSLLTRYFTNESGDLISYEPIIFAYGPSSLDSFLYDYIDDTGRIINHMDDYMGHMLIPWQRFESRRKANPDHNRFSDMINKIELIW
jgi:hypothetical protein